MAISPDCRLSHVQNNLGFLGEQVFTSSQNLWHMYPTSTRYPPSLLSHAHTNKLIMYLAKSPGSCDSIEAECKRVCSRLQRLIQSKIPTKGSNHRRAWSRAAAGMRQCKERTKLPTTLSTFCYVAPIKRSKQKAVCTFMYLLLVRGSEGDSRYPFTNQWTRTTCNDCLGQWWNMT